MQVLKTKEAYAIYKRLVIYYGVEQLVFFTNEQKPSSFEELKDKLPQHPQGVDWLNIGGQLIPKPDVETLLKNIKSGEVKSWNEIHQFYQQNGKLYSEQKLQHAFASLLEILRIDRSQFHAELFADLLQQALETKTWMMQNIYNSRAKDYQSEFRLMVYDNKTEMENVIGKLDDNIFISQQQQELATFIKTVDHLTQKFSPEKVSA